jgi:hypothetical protein
MVGIRVKSENWRKEENATKPKMLGKNFLVKSKDCRDTGSTSWPWRRYKFDFVETILSSTREPTTNH